MAITPSLFLAGLHQLRRVMFASVCVGPRCIAYTQVLRFGFCSLESRHDRYTIGYYRMITSAMVSTNGINMAYKSRSYTVLESVGTEIEYVG